MKILLISGFLGAGKTSFIKALSKNTGREFVIVENEFGNVDIDGQILKQETINQDLSNVDMKIWELSEGCICCSLNLDFAHSVLTIANSLDPDYLIVEPSGVALPGNIIEQLNKISYDRIQLLPPITIVDGMHYKNSSKDFSDYFNNQIETAGRIIISKSENMTAQDFENLKKELKIKNDIIFPTSHYSKWDKDMWFNILNSSEKKERLKNDFNISELSEISEDQELENISISNINIKHPLHLMYLLDILASGALGRVIRAKGYFKTEIEFLKFDFVNGIYSIGNSEYMKDSRIVIIGRHLNRFQIKLLFENKSLDKFRSIKISKSAIKTRQST